MPTRRPHTRCKFVHADMGGVCTFCGAQVSLSRSGTSEIRPSAAERLSKAKPGKGTMLSSSEALPASSAASDSTAVAEARAFKDRLVCDFIMLYYGAVSLILAYTPIGFQSCTHCHCDSCGPLSDHLRVS